MAWMSEAEYELKQDCRDKKITARSARSTRTHCGKRGAVKFPSDYLTKKEREAMNGECKSYRLNDPISWKEFKTWPDEYKKMYIKAVRNKYKTPDKELGKAMGVVQQTFARHIKELGLSLGKAAGSNARKWKGSADERAFREWWYGTCEDDICEEAVEGAGTDELIAVNEEPEITINPHEVAEKMKHAVDGVISQSDIRNAAELMNKAWRDMTKAEETESTETLHICDSTYHQLPVIPKNGTMTFGNNYADDALTTIRSVLCNMKVNLTISWEVVGGWDE